MLLSLSFTSTFAFDACIMWNINNKEYSCNCDKAPGKLSNFSSAMFSSATLCVLSSYDISFDFALWFISQVSLFQWNWQRKEKTLC
jgi:hypothetical protein